MKQHFALLIAGVLLAGSALATDEASQAHPDGDKKLCADESSSGARKQCSSDAQASHEKEAGQAKKAEQGKAAAGGKTCADTD